MNCGQELFDYVGVIDPRSGITSYGWVGTIRRIIDSGVYRIELTLGGLVSKASLPAGSTYPPPNFPKAAIPANSQAVNLGNILKLRPAMLPAVIDINFTSVDNDDISWTAGSITCADGTVQAIDADTLHLADANPFYLYCNLDDANPEVLKGTSTFGDSIGNYKILVAFVKKASAATEKAMIVSGLHGKNPTIAADAIFVSKLSAIAADMGLLTAGEIRVGTGTLGGSPAFTGWRLWVDSNIGRMAGYAGDVPQWYSDTNGKLYAGGGKVIMDATYGLTILGNYLIIKYNSAGTSSSIFNDSGADLNISPGSGEVQFWDAVLKDISDINCDNVSATGYVEALNIIGYESVIIPTLLSATATEGSIAYWSDGSRFNWYADGGWHGVDEN
jgi:hypothetical protein